MSLTAALAFVCCLSSAEVPPLRLTHLGRGISLSPAWSKEPPPALDSIGETVKEEDLAQLYSLGFRNVRVDLGRGERRKEAAMLKSVLDAKLAIVLRVRPNEVSWADVSQLIAPFDPDFVFVQVPPNSVSAARATLASITLVTDMSPDGPLTDGDIVYRTSFEEPSAFTRQRPRLDLPYPSSPQAVADRLSDLDGDEKVAAKKYGDERWNSDRLSRLARTCSEWARKNRVPVLCEFACTAAAPGDSRAQWTTDARTAIESYNLLWQVGDYDGPAKLFRGTPHDHKADADLLKALGLSG